jgi:AraC-like DNA-binding protein
MPFLLRDSSCSNVIPASIGLSREISDFIERIRNELPLSEDRSGLPVKTYLKMILLALVNYYSEIDAARESVRRQQTNINRMAPVLEHLERHYDEPIRVDQAARMCAMSACCFMHLFKEVTGQSFVGYFNHLRVGKAKTLLVSTNKSIADISLETGFCNQSYFGAIFRRVMGVTPLAYRLDNRSRDAVESQTAVSPPSTVKMPPMQ